MGNIYSPASLIQNYRIDITFIEAGDFTYIVGDFSFII